MPSVHVGDGGHTTAMADGGRGGVVVTMDADGADGVTDPIVLGVGDGAIEDQRHRSVLATPAEMEGNAGTNQGA